MKKLLFILTVLCTFSGFSQKDNKRVTLFNLEKNVAIQGYDPVAYFKQGKAVKGKKEITASYEGVVYYFSMPVNKEYFLKNPSKFEPQYGGWCAYAMGDSNEKVSINPETFKISNGKLYLFYNAFFNNTLKSWNKEETRIDDESGCELE
ncbi:YHS domain-containing (seleno)protein [Flavobacterium yafengii]|uniref:YHS domain-containing (seleno)protein n=1 Tax=Flavobacterium yafengii TaxID=3041253 RepID=UPI0024A7CC30|nr:YHS domain-containing (seleno)protein [Flavobacterium yafengii]MDI5887551.1 YHS domain-containing (seleno)protein [Flavobacterium yafengii]